MSFTRKKLVVGCAIVWSALTVAFLHSWTASSSNSLLPAPSSDGGGDPADSPARARRAREFWSDLRSIGTEGVLVVLPTTPFDNVPHQRPAHLARVFARHGWAVLYACSRRFDAGGVFRGGVSELGRLESGVYDLPALPPRFAERPGGWRVMLWAVTYNARMVEVVSEALDAQVEVVYDLIDSFELWTDALSGRKLRELRAVHAAALRDADHVLYVARELLRQDRLLAAREDAVYLPNGVAVEDFEGRTALSEEEWRAQDTLFARAAFSGRPVVGYFGFVAEWFDFGLLAEVAALRQDLNFVIVGPTAFNLAKRPPSKVPDGLAQLRKLRAVLAPGSVVHNKEGRDLHWQTQGEPASGIDSNASSCDLSASLPLCRRNVYFVGAKAYEQLAAYLKSFDVAMIPFAINEVTLATSPLKLYEYFAQGKPVVTTPLPECAAFENRLWLASNPSDFSLALSSALKSSRDPAFSSTLVEIARNNSWDTRYHQFLRSVTETR